MPVQTKLQVRRDTAANWTSTNPTLAAGEFGFETDTGDTKIGDGSTAWNSLAYLNQSRVLGFISGEYYFSPATAGSSFTAIADRTYFAPFYVSRSTTFDRIACRTGSTYSGNATVRLGIYNHDATTCKPSTVLLDAGTVATTAASTTYAVTISQVLGEGWYWLAFNSQDAATTNLFSSLTNILGVGVTRASSSTNFSTSSIGWYEDAITGTFATAGTLVIATNIPIAALRVA